MKSKNDNQMWGKKNTESESHKQKLITEFTPFTGLRIWVPLQWVPIQLMALNGTNGSGINLSICRNRMLDRKYSRPPL